MKAVATGTTNTVVHLHKAIEACARCIGHLSVIENTQVGYGVSGTNYKKIVSTLKALRKQGKKLSVVSRRWMR